MHVYGQLLTLENSNYHFFLFENADFAAEEIIISRL